MVDISFFSLDIIRKDRLAQFTPDFKEADVFQQLCFDLLCWELKGKIDFTPYKTTGPDGAVDISGIDKDGNTVICECKKNNSLENAEGELNKLKTKLIKNLRKPAAPDSLYSPWFNPGFTKYIYCVSCTVKHKHEQDEFKEKVAEMVKCLSKIDGLSHLKNVKVMVYYWNNLEKILENNPFLFHKWIEDDRIPGREYLRKYINPERPRFKDYLYSEKLPYISRDEYKKNNPGIRDFVSETEILEKLLHEDQYGGCIIYGEGGIGKTRLMMELGFRVEKKGWIVYKITNELKDLSMLGPGLYPDNKYLLIFDYIEENPLFDEHIVEKLEEISPHATVKVIGNCRNTHIDTSGLLDAPDFLKVNLTLQNKIEEISYKDFIVEKILGDVSGFFKTHKDFYKLRPAFAVFLRFLHEKYREQDSDSDFKNFDSFRNWLKRRLTLTFKKENFNQLHEQRELFYLFTVLPSQFKITDDLCAKYNDYISALKKDGWLEDDENVRVNKEEFKNELRVIHDTIADEILIFRLEKYANSLKPEIRDIFDFAIENNSFERCFRAFERAADWDGFREKKYIFYEIFTDLINGKAGLCGNRDKFVTTSLLEEEGIVKLLLDNLDFFEEHINDMNFGLKLSFTMNYFSKIETASAVKENVKELFNIWFSTNQDFYKYKRVSLRILSTFILLFGLSEELGQNRQSLKEYVTKCLRKFPEEMETSFVIKAWLDAGGEKERIEEYIKKWLKKFPEEMETNFVIKSWLDAGGEKERIEEYIKKWLKKFPEEMETSFVIKSWLNAGGERRVVEDYIKVWINKFPEDIDAHFVIKAWFDAGGEKERIEEYARRWLKKFPEEMETSFVIESWLNAGGEKERIEEYARRWLEKFPEEVETSFIIASWLNAGGEKERIEEYIKKWLKKFPEEKEAQFVIASWLNAGGEKERIEEYARRWLEKFPEEFETRFVITSWLDARGEIELIEEYIKKWLKKFPEEFETRFVITSWLDARGEIELIEEYIKKWLKKFPEEKEAQFVIASWLNAGGEKERIEEYARRWLKKFPEEMGTSFVIKSWLKHGGNREVVKKYIKPWLSKFPLDEENTSFVIKAWLDAGGEPEEIEEFVTRWLDKYQNSSEASYVIKSWIRRTKNFEFIKSHALQWLLIFKDHKYADFVIKQFCRFKDIPPEVLEIAINWCKKYPKNIEVLYTISRLSEHHIMNDKVSAIWLIEIVLNWINKKKLKNMEIGNLERIMFYISKNENFFHSEQGIELRKKWFLSKHSFHPYTLQEKFIFLQDCFYFESCIYLLNQGLVDFLKDEDKIQKFLIWVNKWQPENKKTIKQNIKKLKKTLPEYNHLWEIVQFDSQPE